MNPIETRDSHQMKGKDMSATYEPQIVAFCCKYCAYAAGDLAGSMRLNYPSNVKVIQMP